MKYPVLWLQNVTYPAVAYRQLVAALWPTAATSGGAVTVAGAMALTVAAGRAAIPAANGTGAVLCPWDAAETVTLEPAAGVAGTNRIDLIVVRVAAAELGAGAGDSFDIAVVRGAEAPSPNPPAVPAGGVALAQVYVTGGAAAITPANITDRRTPARPTGIYADVARDGAQGTTAAGVAMNWDVTVADPAGMWTPAQTGFVVRYPGRYGYAGTLSWNPTGAGDPFVAELVVNGTVQRAVTAVAAGGWAPSITFDFRWNCPAGAVVQLRMRTPTGNRALAGNHTQNFAHFEYRP